MSSVELINGDFNELKDEDEEDTFVGPEDFFRNEEIVLYCRTEDKKVNVEIICHVLDAQNKTNAEQITFSN